MNQPFLKDDKMNVQRLFELGMKRPMGGLIDFESASGLKFNLGGGKQEIAGFTNLSRPDWDGEISRIPATNGSVNHIVAFHFLEHLSSNGVIHCLRESERALVPGGTMTIVVPHRMAALAFECIDHKTFFNEDTWKNIFSDNTYWDDLQGAHGWRFDIQFNAIIGVVERNLSVMTQLVKRA